MVNTDKVWAEPARFTARAFAAKGVPAYIYLFSYVSSSMQGRMRYGAAHGSEIPYVFDNLGTHIDVYDKPQFVAPAVGKLKECFDKYLT